MKVVALAAADAPSQAAAVKLAAAVRASALSNFGTALPDGLTKAASSLDLGALSRDPALQSAAVPLLQAAAAAGGASWPSVALVGAVPPTRLAHARAAALLASSSEIPKPLRCADKPSLLFAVCCPLSMKQTANAAAGRVSHNRGSAGGGAGERQPGVRGLPWHATHQNGRPATLPGAAVLQASVSRQVGGRGP